MAALSDSVEEENLEDVEDEEQANPATFEEEAEEAADGDEEDEEKDEEARDDEEAQDGEDLADSSDEEEGQNEYDMNDKFLVADEDEDEDEGDEEDTEAEKKRRRRRKRREAQLDEEDYEVIGQRAPRPAEQRKRIRKMSEAGAGDRQRMDADRLREDLFGPEDEGLEDEDEEAPAAARQEQRRDRDDDVDVDEDEFADFLDDGDEEGAGEGRQRRRRSAASGLPAGISSAAVAEAQDIFGDVADLLEEYTQRRRQPGDDEADDLDEEQEDEDEEAAEERYRLREERQRLRAMRKVTEAVEPEVMERAMLRPEDDIIRSTDLPEREQLLKAPPPASLNHRECAEWIRERLVGELSSDGRLETRILLSGRREVDGMTPPYDKHDLEGGPSYIPNGARVVKRSRRSKDEVEWVKSDAVKEKLIESIREVLVELFDKHMEVPFIAAYRKRQADELMCARKEDLPQVASSKEEGRPRRGKQGHEGIVEAQNRRIRRWELLWYVHSMALKWQAFARRKERRLREFQAALEVVEDMDMQAVMDALIEALKGAPSDEDVMELEANYNLASAELVERVAAMQVNEIPTLTRRPKRTSAYETYKRAGLEPLVREMYITAKELGENLEGQYTKTEANDIKSMPEELAAEYINEAAGLSTPEAVLAAARKMAVSELLAEPEVSKYIRLVFREGAVVSTDPTPQGEQALDAFHQYGQVKRLRNKPAGQFIGTDQFLRLVQAEKEGLITAKIEVDEEKLDGDLKRQLKDFYLSTGTSKQARAWNRLREDTIMEALDRKIGVELPLQLRERLLLDARDAVLHQISDKLWDYAKKAPHQIKQADEDELVEQRRFLAVCWGPGDPATTLVMLDHAGQLVDTCYAGRLSGNIPRSRSLDNNPMNDPAKGKDNQKIRDFVLEHRPHVVLVAGTNLQCRDLYTELVSIRDHILTTNPQFLTRSETGDMDIVYVDDSLATLWENSAAARQELADQPPIVRKAVALGRCSLDPLPVLASLCGPSAEIVAMNLHPLKNLIPRQDIAAAAERVCITAVNQVGVDINRVAHSTWEAASLQFVAGLGPRKAQALIRAVQKNEGVPSRFHMWRELGVLGKVVFRNCGGFIRVTLGNHDMDTADMDALDASRIHPSNYDLAKRLARAVLGPRAGDDDEDDVIIERLLGRTQDLDNFKLMEFNELLMSEGSVDNLTMLRDLTFELAAPFGEVRIEAGRLKETDIFWLLTGETPETLLEGRPVSAVVTSVGRDNARVRLPDFSNLDGIIHAADVSSSEGVNPSDRMQRGQTVSARIKSVSPDNFLVDLTTASKDLQNHTNWEEKYCGKKDEFYHVLTEEEEREQKRANERKRTATSLIKRPIRHPYFKNVNPLEATEALRDAPLGEYLLRPSIKYATSAIAITIKVQKASEDGSIGDMFMHTDIMEGPKEGGPGAHLQLGKPLTIRLVGRPNPQTGEPPQEQYEDLDEVLARYAEPLVKNIKDVLKHRKYRAGTYLEHIVPALTAEKQRTRLGAVYCLGTKLDKSPVPATYYLAHIINTRPHREYFTATPAGFYFRRLVRRSVDDVIREFKEHPHPPEEREPEQPPAPASMPQQMQQPMQQQTQGWGAPAAAPMQQHHQPPPQAVYPHQQQQPYPPRPYMQPYQQQQPYPPPPLPAAHMPPQGYRATWG